MQRLVRHPSIARLILLVIFVIVVGALLRDHTGLPVLPSALFSDAPDGYEGKNHLAAGAETPFLQIGATQPVWWFDWERDAFATARMLNRPILLYSCVVWHVQCRALDARLFSDAGLARRINRWFVPIRVDRELRPDLDQRYRTAAKAIGGSADMAVVAFLTPDGEIFYAMHESPEDFEEVLATIATTYTTSQASLDAVAARLHGQLQEFFLADWSGPSVPSLTMVRRFRAQTERDFDTTHGGFLDPAGKFPEPAILQLYLHMGIRLHDRQALEMALQTLRRMGASALYDHLEGGFFWGARDREWRSPYFAKLLSVNAQLLHLYVEAYAATNDPALRTVAESLVRYLGGRLWDQQQRAFRSSEMWTVTQATWTWQEIHQVLSGRALQVAIVLFDLRPAPRIFAGAPKANVLARARTVAEVARQLGWRDDEVTQAYHQAVAQLATARAARAASQQDATAYADANGMAIAALFRAGQVLALPDAHALAQSALERWREEAGDFGAGFPHRVRANKSRSPWLSDQVWMLDALLHGHAAARVPEWLADATTLATFIEQTFSAPKLAGFFDRPAGPSRDAGLGMLDDPVRPYFDDREYRAVNPQLALAYQQLVDVTGNQDWQSTADGILLGIGGAASEGSSRVLATYVAAVLARATRSSPATLGD